MSLGRPAHGPSDFRLIDYDQHMCIGELPYLNISIFDRRSLLLLSFSPPVSFSGNPSTAQAGDSDECDQSSFHSLNKFAVGMANVIEKKTEVQKF